ncbi:transcription antitermination protein NusB [[Mycoplasma] phocae]|uniref:Transcription antitermination protein NusB n=1 Tax=[Mycoplasma] phocae TaxID=142651 RepID=A0A2Z5IQT0_9BACT|nr:transcription antitermination factor NusB [[Mycoplasma] phocae]AXE60884.1 transcription antitermination protein NusB [[Mycoplasma] phocae]
MKSEDNNEKNINYDKVNFLLKNYERRVKIITYIYQFELFNKKISCEEIFKNNDLDKWEVATLELIEQKYDTFIKIANKFIDKNWEWQRILPLTRAIIIFGEYELLSKDSKIVINEMVNIAKIFIPNDDYKFINKILDLISKQVFNK